MIPRLGRYLVVTLSIALLSACGGSSSPTGSGGNGPMSARINGTAWGAEALLSYANLNETDNLLVIYGLNTGSYSVAINLDEATTTGTYVLTNTLPLRFAVVSTNAGGSWASSFPGGSGSVTISTFSQTRIAGTFQFTAPAASTSSQQGTLAVTAGEFDLELIRLNP